MHALVIGAGYGGMAAALRLRAKGYQVTLIDRSPGLGGRAQIYEREGFRHDAGPQSAVRYRLEHPWTKTSGSDRQGLGGDDSPGTFLHDQGRFFQDAEGF